MYKEGRYLDPYPIIITTTTTIIMNSCSSCPPPPRHICRTKTVGYMRQRPPRQPPLRLDIGPIFFPRIKSFQSFYDLEVI